MVHEKWAQQKVMIFLTNGVKLNGVLTFEDRPQGRALWLTRDGSSQQIMPEAIATICPLPVVEPGNNA